MADTMISAGGGLSKKKLALANAAESDVLSGKRFYAGSKVIKEGRMPNRGSWGTSLSPGGVATVPSGYHNGSGQVTAAALKTVTMNVASWPHEYPAMEWHYTLTGGTLVGIASLDGASGDGSSNSVDRIRIVGNTIYVQNRQSGVPNRNITLLYY